MPRGKKNGATPADDEAPKKGDQLSLNLTFDTYDERKRTITALMQQMADVRTDLANEYKAFEEEGGDRKMLKLAIKLEKQDPAKTAAELRQFDQYRAWSVQPKVDALQNAGSED